MTPPNTPHFCVSIDRNALATAMARAAAISSTRTTVPILAHALLTATADGVLSVLSTDLDISMLSTLHATVATPGCLTVPAALLDSLLKTIPAGTTVELDGRDEDLHIRAGRSSFVLHGLDPEAYPIIATDQFESVFDVPSAVLKSVLGRPAFAVARDETRYYLNGVYLHIADDLLTGVGTDGSRLTRSTEAVPEGAEGMPGVIVPSKTNTEFLKMIDGVEVATLSVSPSKIRISVPGAVMTSKVIDATYPDYARIIPKANDNILTVDAKALGQAIARVVVIASEKTREIKLQASADRALISIPGSTNGAAEDELAAAYDGPDFSVGYNSKFLSEAISKVEAESAELHFSSEEPSQTGLIVRDPANAGVLHLIMPRRI